MTSNRCRLGAAVVAVLLATTGLASACGGSTAAKKFATARQAATTRTTGTSGVLGTSAATTRAASSRRGPTLPRRFDARSFESPVGARNRFLPLTPGLQWIRQGTTEIGHRAIPHRVISTVTDVSRMVDGVRTVAVLDQDVDAGQTVQESLDYLAQDKQGNVWFLGSYTEEYEGGRFVSIVDAWLAGLQGGKPGVLMPAQPRASLGEWTIAQPPGADPDAAEVVRTGMHKCVPFGCFDRVLVVREGKASALDNEFKFYAPGLGQILNTPRSMSAHKDVEALVNTTQLSKRGLAEVSAEALKLDRHARLTKPDVFSHGRAKRLAQ